MTNNQQLMKDLEKCVLCGSCKATCPTYSSSHNEPLSPRGRLKLLWAVSAGELRPSQETVNRVFSCLLCGACSDQCSAGVNILESFYQGRSLLRKNDRSGWLLGKAVKFALSRPELSRNLFRLSQPFIRSSLVRKGLLDRSFRVDGDPLQKSGTVFSPEGMTAHHGRVILFTGCNINYIYPHIGESFIRVMKSLNYEVVLMKKEVCCGSPLLGLGMKDEAERFAMRNIKTFRRLKADAIVSLCPTCVVTLNTEYKSLTGETINAVDIVSFLSDKVSSCSPLNMKAHYHDPCHSLYGLGQKDEPRELLKSAGVESLNKESNCCGFAGTFSLKFQEMSRLLMEERAASFKESDADILVTSCPGCMMQLSKGMPQEKIFHIIEIVEESLDSYTC